MPKICNQSYLVYNKFTLGYVGFGVVLNSCVQVRKGSDNSDTNCIVYLFSPYRYAFWLQADYVLCLLVVLPNLFTSIK